MVIHSSGLNITEVFMATFDNMEFGSVVSIEQVVEDTKEQLLRIYPTRQILPGIITISSSHVSRSNFPESKTPGDMYMRIS